MVKAISASTITAQLNMRSRCSYDRILSLTRFEIRFAVPANPLAFTFWFLAAPQRHASSMCPALETYLSLPPEMLKNTAGAENKIRTTNHCNGTNCTDGQSGGTGARLWNC